MPFTTVLWFVTHAAVLAVMVLAASTVGWVFTRRVEFQSPLERSVFTIAAGLGVWAILLLALGLIHSLERPLIVVLTVFAAVPTALKIASAIWRGDTRLSPRAWLIASIVVAVWASLFFQTLFPPTQWDAISNHLVFAREQLRQSAATAVPGIPHGVLPALNHYLFVWAMALSDDVSAQATQHLFFMLSAAGMIAWGVRARAIAVGVAASALWLSHPLVLTLSQTCYIDVGHTSLIFLALYALSVASRGGGSRWWILSMFMIGMAAGSKLFSLFFVAVFSALGLWWAIRGRLSVSALVHGLVAGFLGAAPWYAFIALATGGNPFWPLLPHWASGIWALTPAVHARGVGLPVTVGNFFLVPLKMATDPIVFRPDFYLGLNPIVAIWPLAWLISFRDRETRWWTLWALAYSAVWFTSAQFVRYFLPAVPLIGMSIASSVSWASKRLPAASAHRVAAVALIVFGSVSAVRHLAVSFEKNGWPPVTPHQREIYLRSFIAGYDAVRFINERSSHRDQVYTLNAGYLVYFLKGTSIDFFGVAASPRLAPTFRWPADKEFISRLTRQDVRWIVVRHRGADWLRIPERDLVREPFWPQFRLVYQDSFTWVFERTPRHSG